MSPEALARHNELRAESGLPAVDYPPGMRPREDEGVPVDQLAVAEKRVRALKLLAPGETSKTNLNAKSHRNGLLAAMSSSDADGVDAWLARSKDGGDRLPWRRCIGYYVSPYERVDRKTGEVIVTDLVRLVLDTEAVIHTHSSVIVDQLSAAFGHGLMAPNEPWSDIEIQISRVKGETTYYQCGFRVAANGDTE